MEDIIIKDNFFHQLVYKELVQKICNSDTKYVFVKNNLTSNDKYETYKAISSDSKIVEEVSMFQHNFYHFDSHKSDNELNEIFTKHIETHFRLKIEMMIRINCNIVVPCHSWNDANYMMPHVDVNIPHKTLIYYVDDCDSDTILFDKLYTGDSLLDIKNLNIVKRITPKKNTAVLFNGLRYHSASPSKTNLRKILNINFS